MKNKKKMSSGITLIALVVTIIVLLILAGISISMLSGNNGILQRATEAKIKNEEIEIKEELTLGINSLGVDYWNDENIRLSMKFGRYVLSNKVGLAKALGVDESKVDVEEYPETAGNGAIGKITYRNRVFEIIESGSIIEANGILVTIEDPFLVLDSGINTHAVAQQVNINANISWESLNPDVATVDSAGTITPVSEGEAEIQARGDYVGKAYTGKAKVKVIAFESIALNYTEATVAIGKTKELNVTVNPAELVDKVTVTWTSENPANATLNPSTGFSTTVKVPSTGATIGGTSAITATASIGAVTKTATCTITTKEATSEIDEGINPDTYGREVNYGINLGKGVDNTSLTWKVFYDDGTNVYLIASDYVKRSNAILAGALSNIGAIAGTGDYDIKWADTTGIFKTFKNAQSSSAANGAADIFTNRPAGTAYLTNRGLLSFWKAKTKTSYNDNAKMTACLMDTKAWSGFVASTVSTASNYNADKCYAIGGATLSLWVESWNAKHGELSNDTKKQQLYYNNVTATGYRIGTGSVPTNDSIALDKELDGYNDTLYFPHKSSTKGCYGYWLASPSNNNSIQQMWIFFGGGIYKYHYYHNEIGVRPVVCLPSTVKVSDTPAENGKYDIINK